MYNDNRVSFSKAEEKFVRENVDISHKIRGRDKVALVNLLNETFWRGNPVRDAKALDDYLRKVRGELNIKTQRKKTIPTGNLEVISVNPNNVDLDKMYDAMKWAVYYFNKVLELCEAARGHKREAGRRVQAG
jgi:hypothetical protein